MPMTDILAAALSRPALRAVEGSLRNLIIEVLDERGYGSPDQLQKLRDEVQALRTDIATSSSRLDQARQLSDALQARIHELKKTLDNSHQEIARATSLAQEAEIRASEAERRSDLLEARVAELEDGGGSSRTRAALPTRHGFAVADFNRWMAGTLPNVVSPEGLLAVGGKAYRVDMAHAGKAYSQPADVAGVVEIEGKQVSINPL